MKNINFGVSVELRSPVFGHKENLNLLNMRKMHKQCYYFMWLIDRIISGYRIAKKLMVNRLTVIWNSG